jgi:methionyl-tRNA formyltransferase
VSSHDPLPRAAAGPRSPRVVFFGSPPFAVPILASLVASEFRPVAVVTPPDRAAGRGRKSQPSPVAEIAAEAGVALLRPERARDPEFRRALRALNADVFLVASYGELFDAELLEMPRRACLNVHGSLLPRWRGASPIQSAILAGDSTTGVTIQRMVEALDAGDVLVARETPIGPAETSGDLFARLAELGGEAALAALAAIATGRETYTPQDPRGVTRCRKLTKGMGELDWSESAVAVERRVRAMTPWPGARTVLPDGRTLGVLRASVLAADPGALSPAPGSIDASALGQGRLVVGTGEGSLELHEVKPEGKRAMDTRAFLNGTPLTADDRLGSSDAPRGAEDTE